jgi:hypothetical protein
MAEIIWRVTSRRPEAPHDLRLTVDPWDNNNGIFNHMDIGYTRFSSYRRVHSDLNFVTLIVALNLACGEFVYASPYREC